MHNIHVLAQHTYYVNDQFRRLTLSDSSLAGSGLASVDTTDARSSFAAACFDGRPRFRLCGTSGNSASLQLRAEPTAAATRRLTGR